MRGLNKHFPLFLFSSPRPSRQLLLRCSTYLHPCRHPAGAGDFFLNLTALGAAPHFIIIAGCLFKMRTFVNFLLVQHADTIQRALLWMQHAGLEVASPAGVRTAKPVGALSGDEHTLLCRVRPGSW